VFERSFFFLVH